MFPGLLVPIPDRGASKCMKSGALDVFFCHDRMVPTALARSALRKCRTISFFGRFFGIVLHRTPP